MESLLAAHQITKRYGAATVLDRVSIDVRGGEIHALLGANGAGKSTLCRILAGLGQADSGSMQLADLSYRPMSKQQAESCGVEIVQQELNLVSNLTVAENILLTRMPSRGGVIGRRELNARARRALDRFGLQEVEPDTPVGKLGVGRQQMVEIAAALDRQCRLLILDEPTAALSGTETRALFARLRELRGVGVGIIYISHRLDEITSIADRVTILRDGKHVCTSAVDSLNTDQMIELMSGAGASHQREFRSFATTSPLLSTEQLSGGMVRGVSFSVARGERLGIAGLVGSGRTELLRLIFGADAAESGWVRIGEQGVGRRFQHPGQAVAAGLGLVTEDRKQNGLLLTQPVRVNCTLSSLSRRFATLGWVHRRRERQVVQEIITALDTRCHSIEQPVATLSGGNQQKIAVSKWLLRDADVFFFDEPTRGIDVAARRRIYRLFESLAQSGKGIVIVSSDLEELFETCDRIGVMSAGQWVSEFARDQWSTAQIMQAAFSGYQGASEVA